MPFPLQEKWHSSCTLPTDTKKPRRIHRGLNDRKRAAYCRIPTLALPKSGEVEGTHPPHSPHDENSLARMIIRLLRTNVNPELTEWWVEMVGRLCYNERDEPEKCLSVWHITAPLASLIEGGGPRSGGGSVARLKYQRRLEGTPPVSFADSPL